MVLFNTDLDDIYNNIKDGFITSENVRIITSKIPQPCSILSKFPNIEEIYCPIYCKYDNFKDFSTNILTCSKLTLLSVIVYIHRSDDEPPLKRRRLISIESEKILEDYIPNILAYLDIRCKYMNLTFTIIDDNLNYVTLIKINKGFLSVVSLYGDINQTSNIFNTLDKIGCLTGLKTDGDSVYDINSITTLNKVNIVPKLGHINKRHLEDLVSKTEIVEIEYTPETIGSSSVYSAIIISGTKGQLKEIKAIIPPIDIEEHIILNNNLEEIHTSVYDEHDVEIIEQTITEYQDRMITYYIHYYNDATGDYWSRLRDINVPHDIIFKDIIKSTMI